MKKKKITQVFERASIKINNIFKELNLKIILINFIW